MDNVIQFQPTSTFRFGPVDVGQAALFGPYEPFVDEHVVAGFLQILPRRILEMARKKLIPAHPLGLKRKTWRFRISEIDAHFSIRGERQGPATVGLAATGARERKRIA